MSGNGSIVDLKALCLIARGILPDCRSTPACSLLPLKELQAVGTGGHGVRGKHRPGPSAAAVRPKGCDVRATKHVCVDILYK